MKKKWKENENPLRLGKRVVDSLLFYAFLLKKMEGKRNSPQILRGENRISDPELCTATGGKWILR
jgi:hypothetical protein